MQPPPVARHAVQAHVHVRVGVCDIAIPIDRVRQALPLPPQGLTALPRRSGALLGVVDMNGAAVPIVALERWLPLQADSDPAVPPRLLVLQHANHLVGMRVDAVLGVQTVAVADIRKLHQTPDDDELFESVVPATASAPTLCLLEVARLMRLTQIWCVAADLAPAGPADTATALPAPEPARHAQHYAVVRIGQEQWAIPAHAVERVVPVPAAELVLKGHQRSWAIGQWQGRKLPLVDISEDRQASSHQSAQWMVLLTQGPLVLGLTVSACQQLLTLSLDAVAGTPEDALRAGLALLPQQGRLQILDVAKLFALTPEASISRMAAAGATARSASVLPDAPEPLPYLVFDADQRYASPVEGLVGVVELPPAARADLGQGRRALLAWRGRTVSVINLPAIARSQEPAEPLLAVLVQPPQSGAAPIGIAIRSLSDWLPAHSARRSGMRMGAMGEFGLINAKGAAEHTNLVVVDLAQMAYLLG